jgi:Uma2 family endonuclease
MALDIEWPATPPLMTEDEFERWCDEDTRAEFVDGKVILMSPVSLEHGGIADFLHKLLGFYLELRPAGRKLPAEYPVRLRSGVRRTPDMAYVLPERAGLLKKTFLDGAPDSAWEIISPDSEERDWRDKLPEYEQAGVREYWIINPHTQNVWLNVLGAGGRYGSVEPADGRLESTVIPGFWLRPEWLWRDPLPGALQCLRELGALD